MSKRKLIVFLSAAIILVAVVIAVAFSYRFRPLAETKNGPQSENVFQSRIAVNEPKLDFVPNFQETKVPLNQVSNYQALKAKYGLNLSAAQEKYLETNKFLLIDLDQVPFSNVNFSVSTSTNFDQWLVYADSMGGGSIFDRKPEDTLLITPDLVLHTYHKYLELTLERLEQNDLSRFLGEFLSGLHVNLATAVKNSNGEAKTRYQNLEAQIVLARVLFENKNTAKPDYFSNPEEEQKYTAQDPTSDSLANAEILLKKYSSDLTPDYISKIKTDLAGIYDAKTIGASPLYIQYDDQIKTDYTQFTPRSHYAKNSILRAYFRTMMYLGRSSYLFKNNIGIEDANLLVKQMAVKNGAAAPLENWKKITAITGFYAGVSDDLSYNEWADYVSSTLGAGVNSDAALIAPDNVAKLAQNLDKLRMPKILSDVIIDDNIASRTKADLLRQSLSFRVFGQKFSFDAWILNDLTAGQEKTETKLPSTPSALFVPAAFGDQQAKNYAQAYLKDKLNFTADEVAGFNSKLGQKKTDIAKVKDSEWLSSLGSAWLHVLGSLTHDYGQDYPQYMQSVSFVDKQIQTFLGSYAELKHDTLLYAKQSYAEMGAGGEDREIPPVVKGFVEPNLEIWTRFNDLLVRTEQLFAANNVFKDDVATWRLQEFKKSSQLFAGIAEKEMRGEAISDEDYESLRTTKLSYMVQPFETVDPNETSGQTALIADIHTDIVESQILYEATAKPYFMLAIVGNEGTPRVTAGWAYNHYELTDKIGQRLTDEDWRNRVYNDNSLLPQKNFWYKSLQVK